MYHHRSTSPIANNENVDSTGFSKAELHDLQQSFKLFDVYGEGSVQVGDLRGILEVLQQEEQEHQSSGSNKYPHLETLLNRLSEVSDEHTLTMDDYIHLMASTTISNAIMIENGNNADDSSLEHFARVFRLFDTDGKGYITQKDLERIAVDLGEHDMTRGELQEMIDRALSGSGNNNSSNNNNANYNRNDGGDGEKRVGIDEFTRMMTMSLFPSNDAGSQ
jgi:Ca2+-binding EF-hand superfamily protein